MYLATAYHTLLLNYDRVIESDKFLWAIHVEKIASPNFSFAEDSVKVSTFILRNKELNIVNGGILEQPYNLEHINQLAEYEYRPLTAHNWEESFRS